MKKIITLLFLTLLIPINTKAVNGGTPVPSTDLCIDQSNCFEICRYQSKSKSGETTEIKVLYVLDTSMESSKNPYTVTFDGKAEYPDGEASTIVRKAECPKNAYYDTGGLYNEICLTNGESSSCDNNVGTDFTGSTSKLEYNHLDEVREAATNESNYSCEKLFDSEKEVKDYLENDIFEILNEKVYFGKGIPEFLIKTSGFKAITTEAGAKYKEFYSKCIDKEEEKLDEQLANGEITQEEYDKKKEELEEREKNVNKQIDGMKTYLAHNPNIKLDINVDATGCALISDEFREWLQWLLDTIRIAGLVAAILLGIIDYTKASLGSQEDALKTANKNFSTRLLSLGILLLVPTIINLALVLFDIGIYENADDVTCGIK